MDNSTDFNMAPDAEHHGISTSQNGWTMTPMRTLIILVVSMFIVELLIMVTFLFIPPLPPIAETIIDSTILTLIVSPIVYFFAIVPLDKQMKNYKEAINSLETINTLLKINIGTREKQTEELEKTNRQLSHRAAQFETMTRLTEAINSQRDLKNIFLDIAHLISEYFGYYHVGIFLVDAKSNHAVLQAANSEGGQRMLERGHKLQLGTGVVGYAAKTGQPRIALDVGTDAVFFDNPDLPETHSETAIPLVLRGETIGVLDVQSTEPGAFTTEDLHVMTTLANQVAIAFENARLLSEARTALTQVQDVYNEFTQTEWRRALSMAEQPGFRYRSGRVEILEQELHTPEVISAVEKGRVESGKVEGSEEMRTRVAVPVKLRGEVIGILHVESNDSTHEWKEDDISLVQAVAERAAFALENARLFQDARRRAAKEQMISEAAARIGGAFKLENILQTTAEELERVLGGSEVLIQFVNNQEARS